MTVTTTNYQGLLQIRGRAELAKQWREQLPTFKSLAERYIYVRIGRNSFRPVSLSPSNPCGRLIREGKETPIKGVKELRNAIRSAERAWPADHYKLQGGKGKPEHQIQAALILHALGNNLELHGLFRGFEAAFDELLFVTDEMAAGEIRADIIALGRKDEQYFPVFIELKVKRLLGTLIGQLERARKAAVSAEHDFLELLANVTGVAHGKISLADARSILVWTEPSGKERNEVATARANGFITATPIYDNTTQRLLAVSRYE